MLLLLLFLLPLAFSQIDYSQLFSFGNGFPILSRDPRQAGPAAFYRNPLADNPPLARGVPINFNSVIHNVKAGVNSVEVYTTTAAPTQAARPRRRHWKRGYNYDAYEGGRSAYPGGYYPEEDGYDDGGGYGPPRRPRPRPRRPPPPRYRRPDDYEGYGRSPPGYESVEAAEGGGGGLFAGGEGTRKDNVKVGPGGKGTISSDSGGLLSSLSKSLGGKGEGTKKDKKDDDEGQKKDAAKHGGDEGVPLEDVKDTGQTRAPGFESVTTKSKVGKKKSRSKLHKKKGKVKGDEDEEEEEEDENGSLEEVDGEVKVPKTVDGETYDSDEEDEDRKKKRKSKKKKRGKKRHHDDEEDVSEDDEDKTDGSLAEIEDEDEEDCQEEKTTTTTQSTLTECEEEDMRERQKKEKEKKKQTKMRNKKKSSGERKKGGNKKTCKKKKRCQNKEDHEGKKRETSDETLNERHGRSDPELEEQIETATNATELLSTTKGQGQIVDCAAEKDEFPTKCGPWKAAGYCENNQATQYLWCRRTCLCSQLTPRPKRAVSWLASLFS